MMTKVPLSELTGRMKRFRARMDAENPNWELAAFFGRVNQYYFTGTMQDGLLLVPATASRCSGCAEVSSEPALNRFSPTSAP